MAVSDFLIPGLGSKQTVKIMTVDPVNRRIEAATKDGAMIQIAVWNVDAVFRWPKEEEVWTVRQDNGIWVLDSIVEQPQSVTTPIESLNAGDMRVQPAPGGTTHFTEANVFHQGIVLMDSRTPPHYWLVTISNVGTLQTTDLGTTPP